MSQPPGKSAIDNRLLSVEQVSRKLGTTPQAVARLIFNGVLASLDEGLLVGEGRYDVPAIRESVVLALLDDLRARSFIEPQPIRPTTYDNELPSLAAFKFVIALRERNFDAAWDLSSSASRVQNRNPASLAEWWIDHLGVDQASEPSVATGMYPIPGGLAVMYLPDSVPFAGRTRQPHPEYMAPMALKWEDGRWVADQPLQARRADWIDYVLSRSRSDLFPAQEDI